MSRKVVYTDYVVDLLHRLASKNFTVMDTTYRRYLDALADVEEGLKDLHQMDVAKIRTGYWETVPKRVNTFKCSICKTPVYFDNRGRKNKGKPSVCLYPFCPTCRTPMEVKE